jgi:hypothetical protein
MTNLARGCLLLLACVAAGCGQAAYDAKLNDTLAYHKYLHQFASLERKLSQIPDTNLAFRMPAGRRMLGYNEQSANPSNASETIPADRVQASFVRLPNLHVTWEIDDATREGNLYTCVYVASVAPPDPDLPERLRSEVAEAFPEAEVAWEAVDLPTPQFGVSMPWRVLTVTGPQIFYSFRTRGSQTTQGTYLLYLYENDQQQVMLGWRFPTSIADSRDYATISRRMAGSLQILGPVVPPSDTAGEPAGEGASTD